MKYVKKMVGNLALALSACLFLSPAVHAESDFYEKAKQEGKVVLYTSFANSDTRVLKEVFDKKFPGVNLDIYRSGGPKILQKILAEHLAGSDFADVVMTKGDAVHLLVQKKLLAKFDSLERKAYEDHFDSGRRVSPCRLHQCQQHRKCQREGRPGRLGTIGRTGLRRSSSGGSHGQRAASECRTAIVGVCCFQGEPDPNKELGPSSLSQRRRTQNRH
jgi:hypothetical protein